METEMDISTEEHTARAGRHKGRVVFLIKLHPGTAMKFLTAYESMRYLVAQGVRGHLADQVCQAVDDPDQWLITSEWESLDDFLAWERAPDHWEFVRQMWECIADARSLRFLIREETTRGSALRQPAEAPG